MDKVYLLSLFQSQKGFLKKLYEGDQTPRILAVANDHSLNVLIRILHLIANGEIVLSKEHASVIKKSLRLNKLRKFESQKYFITLLNNSREQKVLVLKQFSKIYSALLYSFFNQI
jgi:hypothetical protein